MATCWKDLFLFFGSPTKVGIEQVEKISMVEILLSPKVYSQTFFWGPGLHACDSTSTITNGRPIPSRGKPPWSFRTELADFTSLGPRILVVEIWPGSPLHATRLNRNTKFERELEKWGVTTSRHGFVLLCLFCFMTWCTYIELSYGWMTRISCKNWVSTYAVVTFLKTFYLNPLTVGRKPWRSRRQSRTWYYIYPKLM